MTCYWDVPCEPGCTGTATGFSKTPGYRPHHHVTSGQLRDLIRVTMGPAASRVYAGDKNLGKKVKKS